MNKDSAVGGGVGLGVPDMSLFLLSHQGKREKGRRDSANVRPRDLGPGLARCCLGT